MKAKFTFLLFLTIFFSSQVSFSQASGDYRSNVTTTGDWSVPANWESYNGVIWAVAVTSPTNTSGVITIRNGDSIQLTNPTSFDQVIIESGGILALFNNTTETNFILRNGVGTDLINNGKLYIQINATLEGSGTIQNNLSGVFTLNNGGTVYSNTLNNGILNVSTQGNIINTTITNNGTFTLLDGTVNLNTTTLLNNSLISLPSTSNCFFSTSNLLDTGFITNTSTGIIFKTSYSGIAEFGNNIKFINNGTVKGFGEYVFANTLTNTGIISPGDGNNSSGILTVNPAFITGKNPTLWIETNTPGNVAGTNYDQLKISTYNFSTVNFSGVTLGLQDNAIGTAGTVYRIIDAVNPTTNILGPFGFLNIPGTFGDIIFGGSYVTIKKLLHTIYWDGGAGTSNWNDANNWNPNILPNSLDNVTINTGTSISITNAASSRNLILNSPGLVLTIQAGNSLIVEDKVTLTDGILNINGGTLILNGTIASTGSGTFTGSTSSSLTIGGISGGNIGTLNMTPGGTNNFMGNFTLSRSGTDASVTIGSNGLVVTGIMTLANGTLNTGGNLTLRSSSIPLTGTIAPVNDGARINGLVTIERFMPQTRRAFRDIAPSINSGSKTIFNSWQEGGVNNNGFGTQITGSVGTPGTIDAATGFDATSSGNKSMYSMNINTTTGAAVWETVNSTNQANDTLSAFKAYRISIRGNRLNDLSVNTVGMNTLVVLRSKGTILTGPVTFNTSGVTANGGTNTRIRLNSADPVGYSMIGNPYPSPINWEIIKDSSANLDNSYYVFDPNMGTTGAYVTYNAALHINSNNTSAVNKYIQPGQGFFIRNNNSTSPILRIEESHKATNVANLTNVFRTTTTLSKMYFNLTKKVGVDTFNMDGNAIAFSNTFNNAVSNEDAGKIANNSDNLAINKTGTFLSIEGRKIPTVSDTISIRVWALASGGNYQLKINLSDFVSNGLQPILLDRFTNTQTVLPFNTNTVYPFTVTSDTVSYNNRFRVVFNNSALPITFNSIKVYKKNNEAELEWVCNEIDAAYYEVEHSLTASNFNKLATLTAINNTSNATATYLFNHNKTPNGINYYRIKSVDKTGIIKYSNIVNLDMNKEVTFTVYPNPVKGNSFQIQFNEIAKDDYSVEIYNSIGQIVFTDFVTNVNATNHTVVFKNKPISGNYQLIITTNKGKKTSSSLLIQ